MQFTQSLTRSPHPLLILAPLAGISHRGLRSLIEDYGGADYYYNEMISAEALTGCSQYEKYYLDPGPDPERTVHQLIGSSMDALEQAVRRLNGLPCAGIDINMGCSAPAMNRKGAGVVWQQNPQLAGELVERLRQACPDKGLSVKLRLLDDDVERFIAFCQDLVRRGAEAIVFHPRLKDDPWARPARRQLFARVAASLSVPVVLNGDLASTDDLAAASHDYHNQGLPPPPAFMIGRAAIARPWIFAELRDGPAPRDRLACAERFHELLEAWQPADFWPSRAKRFHAFFLAGLTYGTRIASQVQSCPGYRDILPMVRDYFSRVPDDRWVNPAAITPSPL